MNGNEFYVTLISTASTNFFPENTQSTFITKINPPIQLTGNWQVALVESVIPRSWYNITKENNNYTIITQEKKRIKVKIGDASTLIPLLPMRGQPSLDIFSDISNNLKLLGKADIVQFSLDKNTSKLTVRVSENAELKSTRQTSPILFSMLNLNDVDEYVIKGKDEFQFTRSLQDFSGGIFTLVEKNRFKEEEIIVNVDNKYELPIGLYNTKEFLKQFQVIKLRQLPDKKLLLTVPQNIKLRFSNQLRDILGFEKLEYPDGDFIGRYALELNAGITEIFVYSDVVQSHHVGDVVAPVFRIIPVLGEKDDQIVKSYDNPLFFPVRKNYIDTISIELRSATGDPIIFTTGKTLLVLCFKRLL